MKIQAVVALLFFSSSLSAFSSHENWLYGTHAFETVPESHLDIELQGDWGEPGGLHQIGLEWGLNDFWTVAGSATAGRRWDAGFAGYTRVRLGESRQWPLDFSLVAEVRQFASPGPGAWSGIPGDISWMGAVVLAREIADHSLAVNILSGEPDKLEWRAGYRSPYLVYALRLGAEAGGRPNDHYTWWGPQISLELPGDLTITLGSIIPTEDGDPWFVSLRVGYTHFRAP